MQKNLNNISLQFARRVTRSRKTNLTWAGGIFLGTFTLAMAISTMSSYVYSKQTGQDFKEEWYSQRRPAEILVPLALAVLFFLSTVGEYHYAKNDARKFAISVLKDYMRDMHIDVSEVQEKNLYDAADLLIANMPEGIRNAVVEIGVNLNNTLDRKSFMNGPEERDNLFKTAIVQVSQIIDSLLADNPELEQSMLYILQGIKPMQQPVQAKEK